MTRNLGKLNDDAKKLKRSHDKHLAELRDSDRKRFHEMSATEQRDLEDFDCGRSKKRHDEVRIRKRWIRVSDL